jgi:hypothetical protein
MTDEIALTDGRSRGCGPARRASHSRGLCLIGILALQAGVATGAAAQVPSSTTTPTFDATGSAGWFFASPSTQPRDRYEDHWYGDSGYVGAALGVYWTAHFKTEVEVGLSSEGEVFTSGAPVPLDGSGYVYPYVVTYYATRTAGVAQVLQLGRNSWVHPFLGAGVAADWRRERVFSPEVTRVERTPAGFVDVVVRPALEVAPTTRVHGRVYGLAGAKFYVTPRMFARTDLKLGVTDRLDEVTWRLGFGVDF